MFWNVWSWNLDASKFFEIAFLNIVSSFVNKPLNMKTNLLSVFLIFISNTVSAQDLEFKIEKAKAKCDVYSL